MATTNAFNRFFRDWTADTVRHGDELWYDSSYHPRLWTDVYQQVQQLVNEEEFNNLKLEKKHGTRCFRTSGPARKNKGNLLEERPYIYVYAAEHLQSPIVIKILFSAQGIEVGLDFVERDKQAKAAGLREAYHAFLSMPELLQGFRFFNDRQDCGGLQAAKQAYTADKRIKINPLLEISRNEGWSDAQYLDALREVLRNNTPLLWAVLSQQQPEEGKSAKITTDSPELPTIARQCIYAGAPGTGKSHNMKKLAEETFKDNIRRVTFHPEYAYYDFVGTYRPTMDKESKERKIVYKFAPGPFAKTLKDALNHPKTPYCLLIEEINRARVAAVFGDIFQLLDRFSASASAPATPFESEYPVDAPEELWDYLTDEGRNEAVLRLLEKKNGMIYLPDNLYIYASMNSADQGVFPMDTAFKRRWSFAYTPLNPSAAEKKDIMAKIRAREGVSETTAKCWDAIRCGINTLLKELHVNEDKMMGFFFLKEEERKDAEHLQRALEGKVLMYLFEDVAQVCHGSMFKKELKLYSELREALHRNWKKEQADLGIFCKALPDYSPEQHPMSDQTPPEQAPDAPAEQAADEEPEETNEPA